MGLKTKDKIKYHRWIGVWIFISENKRFRSQYYYLGTEGAIVFMAGCPINNVKEMKPKLHKWQTIFSNQLLNSLQ